MTQTSVALLRHLRSRMLFAAVTTRTPPALRDLDLPGGPLQLLAASNGARIFEDGKEDGDWFDYAHTELIDDLELDSLHRRLLGNGHPEAVIRDRTFVRALATPDEDLGYLPAMAHEHGMKLSVQGLKIHFVPATLSKGRAAEELRRRSRATRLVSSGDSNLDLPLLRSADVGIRPAHGELHAPGAAPAGVVVTTGSGPTAAEEVLQWALKQDVLD